MLFYFTRRARTSKESFAQMTRAWVLSYLVAYPTLAAIGTLRPWNLLTAQRYIVLRYALACTHARESEEV